MSYPASELMVFDSAITITPSGPVCSFFTLYRVFLRMPMSAEARISLLLGVGMPYRLPNDR